jgi:hypothetical protein
MKSLLKLSGDARVAYVEGQRELQSDWPDESRDVHLALCWSRGKRNGKPNAAKLKQDESLRKRFAAFRAARAKEAQP